MPDRLRALVATQCDETQWNGSSWNPAMIGCAACAQVFDLAHDVDALKRALAQMQCP
jgi:hypothetical protein